MKPAAHRQSDRMSAASAFKMKALHSPHVKTLNYVTTGVMPGANCGPQTYFKRPLACLSKYTLCQQIVV